MRWLRDTLCMMGWSCGVAGGFTLFMALLFSTFDYTTPDKDPSQVAAAAIFLLFASALCFSATKAMGGNLNPYHNIDKHRPWRDRTLSEKKEWIRIGFALMRGTCITGVYATLCFWMLSRPVFGDSLMPGAATFCLAVFSGMLLAESVMWAVFVERPIFAKSGLYLWTLLYVATFYVVMRIAEELDSLSDYRVGLMLAVILAVPAVVIRLLPRRRRANSVETRNDAYRRSL